MLSLERDTQWPHARAVLPLLALACGLLNTSCEEEGAACLPKHPMFAGPLCASQLCVEVQEPETVLSDATDKSSSLTCAGCEQPGPTQYRLEIAVGSPGTGDWFHRPNSVGSLALREQWDRSFTVSALNAALQSSSINIRNVESTTSGERVLMASYGVDSGDVLKATQSGGRVQLTLRGHLISAAVSDPLASPDCNKYIAGCACGYGGSNAPPVAEFQNIKIDLPYRVLQP